MIMFTYVLILWTMIGMSHRSVTWCKIQRSCSICELYYRLTYGQSTCSKYTDGTLRDKILNKPHSISEFRLKGPLSNNPDFARDFNCPQRSNMNPVSKCTVWWKITISYTYNSIILILFKRGHLLFHTLHFSIVASFPERGALLIKV